MEPDDRKLTEFGKAILRDRYLLEGEDPEDMFRRVAATFSSNDGHRKRIYSYMKRFWFMGATPVLSNAGTERGLPISCYVNNVDDSLESIADKWNENIWIGSRGGGIGTCWSDVRSVGGKIQGRGVSSGVIPFMKVMDSQTLAISQGSLRRGSASVYLHISHPEIEEFLEIRKPSGDFNRKSLNLHHGIVISDKFMEAVRGGEKWELIQPNTKEVFKTIDARELFQLILETRMATGQPYLFFEDTVNRNIPNHHRKLGLKVKQSNLCSEITLPTGIDHKGNERTGVCCLGSVNLEYYDEWKDEEMFIEDCLRFLDNVLEEFIERGNKYKSLQPAIYSAKRERSVGLGAMGLQSYFQRKGIPFESVVAKSLNEQIFNHMRVEAEKVNTRLARELGSCPDAIEADEIRRFSYMLAIAPTASISIICGGVSPCVEPMNSNIFTQKTLTGNFEVKNKYLTRRLEELGENTQDTWDSIVENNGSVSHLECLTDREKEIFKTAFEIDQRWLIEFAADRAKYIDQAQSINLFLNGDVDKWELLMLHMKAWELGVKSLYYMRSKSVQRASYSGSVADDNKLVRRAVIVDRGQVDYDECLACQ